MNLTTGNRSNTVPLSQVLPWSAADDANGRVFVICDSYETDGRFLLHTLTKQTVSATSSSINKSDDSATSNKGRVFWISCGPYNDKLIINGLKKIGCDVASSYIRTNAPLYSVPAADDSTSSANSKQRPLEIISVSEEVSKILEEKGGSGNDNDNDFESSEFDDETYLKELYHKIKSWSSNSSKSTTEATSSPPGASWIILDDVSALATLFGERLVYFFIMSIRSMIQKINNVNNKVNNVGLIIRCSSDYDHQNEKSKGSSSSSSITGGLLNINPTSSNTDWICAGGLSSNDCYGNYGDYENDQTTIIIKDAEEEVTIPWEYQLIELADGIIDVLPLSSGYSREAHGRLVFTERPDGRGWTKGKNEYYTSSDESHSSIDQPRFGRTVKEDKSMLNAIVQQRTSSSIVNYCITDNNVLAIRLQR